MKRKTIKNINELHDYKNKKVKWINLDGLQNTELLKEIADEFDQ